MRGEGIIPVMEVNGGNGNNGGNNGGWGDDFAWIIILFLIFGWGNRGFGNGFGGGSGAADGYILATDMAQLDNKIDRVNQGLCDGFYTTAQQIYGIQNTLCQGFNGLNVAYLQGNYNLSSQLADCCCGLKTQLSDCCCRIERGIDGINYNNALQTNALQQTLCNNTRDIIENQNANYRAIHEELVANKLEAKNDRIAELTSQVNKLQLAASQERQSNYLLSELKPCPSAAYIVPNPNCCYDYTVTRNACCNNGCY